jgi:ubiquinone/menaquinone biosynthesis C-methylase UbiE
MENRKIEEIKHYDKKAEKTKSRDKKADFDIRKLESIKFFYKKIAEHCPGKIILDYGCGNGIHSNFPIKNGAIKVIAIDLSEKSLEIARKRNEGENVEFIVMDCENMTFANNSFDIIMDGGTFSSLDLGKALLELRRALKKDGAIIGIETLGHNPLINLKRILNKKIGKRTGWAASHIFKLEDLDLVRKYFNKIEINYFHQISWLVFPLLGFPGGNLLLKFFQIFDKLLNRIPFLRKYSFKVVFVFSQPKNKNQGCAQNFVSSQSSEINI